MKSFGITDKGKVRKENQDGFVIERMVNDEYIVAVVCDGMGGARAGNIASELSVKTFMSYVRERLAVAPLSKLNIGDMLEQACAAANNMVYTYSCFGSEYEGMGTTLVGAVITRGKVYVVNVGDSRAYRIRKNEIIQISKDHSLVQEMIDSGMLTESEARTHPRRNVITRALGVDYSVPSDIFSFRLSREDVLLLCSDGLTNMINDDEILAMSSRNHDPLSLGRALMKESLERGAHDNVTIVAVTR